MKVCRENRGTLLYENTAVSKKEQNNIQMILQSDLLTTKLLLSKNLRRNGNIEESSYHDIPTNAFLGYVPCEQIRPGYIPESNI